MRELIFVAIGFMFNMCIDAMNKEIIRPTRNNIGYRKISKNENIKIYLIIGNKQFEPADLKDLSASQKDILFKIGNPHRCLASYGVDNTTVRRSDVKRLKKMPAHITEKLGVFVIKEKPEMSDNCLFTSVGACTMLPIISGLLTAYSSICFWGTAKETILCWAGLGQCLYGGACLATGATIAYVQPCLYQDKEWYEFGISDNSDSSTEEQQDYSYNEQEDSVSD